MDNNVIYTLGEAECATDTFAIYLKNDQYLKRNLPRIYP